MLNRHDSEFSSIYNFVQWQADLASSGQPEAEELEGMAGKGYQWVINLGLADTDYALDDEAGLVAAMGLHYRHIPVIFAAPTQADFDRFVAVMHASEGERRYVHCAANYRASVFIALYLYFYKQYDYESVMDRVYQIWQPDSVWRRFICKMLEQHPDSPAPMAFAEEALA